MRCPLRRSPVEVFVQKTYQFQDGCFFLKSVPICLLAFIGIPWPKNLQTEKLEIRSYLIQTDKPVRLMYRAWFEP